jgi:hypothetical protein
VTKKPRHDAGTMPPSGWSIGLNGLTSPSRSALLKQLGERMKAGYTDLVNEPLPADLDVLLERLRELAPNKLTRVR